MRSITGLGRTASRNNALDRHHGRRNIPSPLPHASCVAGWVTRIATQPTDVRTVKEWCRVVGVSATSLRVQCDLAGLRAKDALDFGRVLRAVLLSAEHGRRVADFLDVHDNRTLRTLFLKGGIKEHQGTGPQDFLDRQALLTNPDVVSLVVTALDRGPHIGTDEYGFPCQRQAGRPSPPA